MVFSRFVDIINKILNAVNMLYNIEENVYINDDNYNIAEIKRLFIEYCKTIGPKQHKYGEGQLGRALRYMEKTFQPIFHLNQWQLIYTSHQHIFHEF